MAPFLSKHKKVSPLEADLLDFLRDAWHSPELSHEYGDGIGHWIYGRMHDLSKQKNSLIDRGITGKEFEEVVWRIHALELFSAKWGNLMKSYKDRE